ncbi:MAG: 5-deoxy-glucuronate isomerase [Propionibacteriaceae bacterium]
MGPTTDELHLSAGTAGTAELDLEITPESAGWGYSSLRVVTITAAGDHRFATGGDEVLVVPLQGAVTVEVEVDATPTAGVTIELAGRADVFAGPTDFAYVPRGHTVRLHSAHGGRFALCGARTDRDLAVRHGDAAAVPVELRGAGQCSRQVRNFATPEAFDAGAIIACEVITPGGNWSSYPAHKHDEAGEHETELEEIYYFEIAAGPHGEPGFGFHRTSSTPAGEIDVLAEVHDRDAVLVPYGWHGPCTAAPGFDMYYLNVMAGPSPERAWKIADHPDQGWIRGTWAHQAVDPRLT